MSILCVRQAAYAQPFNKAKDLNFWNDGRNVTGIRTDSTTISYAEIHGGFKSGDFHDSYESSDLVHAGATAATMLHLPKYSMTGSFSFDQSRGKNMCGSMFIYPGYYPVDVLEFTPGTKILQKYSFSGGIASDLNEHWRIGGKMDFESDDYAKRKDIRHTNYRLDMTVAPGIMYYNDNLEVGFSYIYAKTSESIDAEQIGTATASSYYAFLDKGLMYGTYGVWDGSGIHLAEAGVDRFPVKEISNGAAVQIQVGGLYADAEYLYTKGTIGEKGYTWYEFPGDKVTARAGYRFDAYGAVHQVRLKFSWQRQTNNESVIEKVTEGGVTTPYNYGSNRIFERRIITLEPDYRMYGKIWESHLGLCYSYTQGLSSLMYPYEALQNVSKYSANGSIIMHVGRFDLGASASFFTGHLDEDASTASETSGVETQPYRLEEYYDLQKEYMTATRAGVGISVRYNPGWKAVQGLYGEISGSLMHGFGLDHISGSVRYGSVIKIGYSF
ncbi:MAG: hypothetical protein LKI42_03900 [Bacteroidales bacterium]|nr:hypothetical protein [Bacteroidales bacterium]MCI1784901.1 hypothetical protein [Bacteroidales bacterium]